MFCFFPCVFFALYRVYYISLNLLCQNLRGRRLVCAFLSAAVFSAFQASFIEINTDTPHSMAFVESLFNYSLSFDLNRLKVHFLFFMFFFCCILCAKFLRFFKISMHCNAYFKFCENSIWFEFIWNVLFKFSNTIFLFFVLSILFMHHVE